MQIPYALIGKLLLFFISFIIIASLISLMLGLVLLRKGVLILPRFILFGIESLHFFLKRLVRMLGLNEKLVDEIGIEIRNRIYRADFVESDPNKRILVFPQCLRSPKCPAPLTRYGIQCQECGRCVIGMLKKKAESTGYKVYIVPGGSFVKRIVEKDHPSAALGVACGYELNYSMMEISNFCPVQGVPLLKDGCYCTKVDEELVSEMIFLSHSSSRGQPVRDTKRKKGK
ncbi:MAG: DUF116 domain-containing protein [Theionarchaea archaeon]|nr:DUF116 domain-containing protein [Theionarchaea archaeon]